MANIKWKTGNTADWNTAANWSPGSVPGANDAVTINAAGNYDVVVDDSESAASVTLNSSGATLAVEGGPGVVFSLGGNLSVTAGTLLLVADDPANADYGAIAGGTVTVGTSGTLAATAFQQDPQGSVFEINAVVNLAGATTIASDTEVIIYGGGTISGAVSGAGMLEVANQAFSSATHTYTSTVAALAHIAEFEVVGPTVIIAKNSSGTIAGNAYAAASGSIVLLGGNTITLGGDLALSDKAELLVGSGGKISITGSLDMESQAQIYLATGASVSANGSTELGFDDLGTTIYGGGTFTTAGGTTLFGNGNTSNEALLGQGITWVNASAFEAFDDLAMNIVASDHVTIVNTAAATLDLQDSSANIIDDMTDGTDTLSNAGTLGRGLDKSPASPSDNGTSTIAAFVSNTGLINVEQGTLAFTDGGTLNGTLSGAGTLLLSSGTYTLGTLAGNGHLATGPGATLNFAASPTTSATYVLDNNSTLGIAAGQTFTLSGAFIVGDSTGGGTLSGPGTLSTTGSTTINDLAGGVALSLQNNATWINSGTVTDYGLNSYNTAGTDGGTETILNKGSFTFAGPDAGFTFASNGTDIFSNSGTLLRTGAGTSVLNGTLNSTGLINISSGILQSQRGGGAISGTLSGAGTLALGDTGYTTTGLAGTGTLALNNAYGVGTLTATSTITDSVQIDGGASLAAVSGKNLTLTGSLTIAADSTHPGGAVFSGASLTAAAGTITTTGATTIADQPGGVVLSLQNDITWINTGTVTDNGLGSYNTAGVDGGTETILNKGSFTFAGADAGFTFAANGTDAFTNSGTLTRTGAGTTLLSGALNSTGLINVAGGVLQSQRGGGAISGTLSGVGTLALGDTGYTTTGLAGTGTLALNNAYGVGTLTATATSSITDSVRIDGGAHLAVAAAKNVTLTGSLTIGADSTHPGGAVFSGAGNTAAAGTITTTGTTTIADQPGGVVLGLQSDVTWINTGTVIDNGEGNYNTPGVDGGTETIQNTGSFTFTGPDAGFGFASGGTDIFTNSGTLVRTGAGTSILGGTLNSTGLINVIGGILQSERGGGAISGTLSGAGTLALGDTGYTTTGLVGTGTLALNNAYGVGTLTATTTATITDSVRIDGGAHLAVAAAKNVTLTGSLTIGADSTHPGGAVFSGAGNTAAAGTITTTGTTTIADQPGGVVLGLQSDVTWINTGTVIDNGEGNYNTPGVDGGTETIQNTGSFTFTGSDAGFGFASGGTDIFTNSGTLVRTGAGTSILGGTLNSTGLINVIGGILQSERGGGAISGTLSGAGTLALGDTGYTTTGLVGTGTLALNNAYGLGTLTATTTATITDSMQIDGGADLAVAAGKILTLSGPLAIAGDATHPGGAVFSGAGLTAATGTITTTGTTTIADQPGGVVLGLQSDVTWINTGTVIDSGVGNYNNPGTDGGTETIINKASFTLAGPDADFSLAAGGTDAFTNQGTLLRTGTGVSSINRGIAITNSGTIEVAAGTLALAGGVKGTGILKIDAGAWLEIGTTPASQSITFTGGGGATLQLDAPISRALAGFGAGDRLDFTANPVTSATIGGTTLTVVTASSTTTYTSAGLAGAVAVIASDNTGGSFVSLYRQATATHAPEPLAFGNFHVNSTTGTQQALTVTNSAAADGYSEKLNAGFGAASAGFSAMGTVSGIQGGASNSTLLTATIDTSSAGAKSGTATLTLASNGAGVDGNGITPLPSQTVNLTGAVYNYAAASLAKTTIALGNQHVGAMPSSALTLTNTAATGGFSEALDAKFTGATGSATGTGTATLIAAGASSSALSVGLSPAGAGAASGTETLTYISDGTGTSGLGTTTLGTQSVSITGTFYNLAAGKLGATTIAFGNHHVGDTVTAQKIMLTNSAPSGAFTEALDASLTASGNLNANGTLTGLVGGKSNSTSLTVGETTTLGAINGNVVVGLVSDGNGIDGLSTTTLASQTITVTGANYALATGQLASATLNLGVIHASTATGAALSLTNGAPTGGYGEALDAGLTGASAGLSASGSISLLAAGLTDATTLRLALNTAITGAYNGTATLGLVSDGANTSGLGTTVLTSQTVTVTATVDNYALAAFEDPSGPALTGTSTNETLNLGTAVQGAGPLSVTIGAINAQTGLSDLLGGTISTTGAAGFTNSGFGTFAGLAAGQDEHAQSVTLSTGTAGTFTETILLTTAGGNASGYSGALPTETLTITGTISASVFTTYTLALGPNTIHGADGLGDIFIASAGALNTRDSLTGGSGANRLVLTGAGLFDINAPQTLANIPTINATEGQAAMGSAPDTRQIVELRDSVTETLNVAAAAAAAGNTSAEAITIYAFTGTDTIYLAAGADQVSLGTGSATVTLGGAANSVTGGGGTALISSTAAFATAAITGTSGAATTLEITSAGTVTLNAADTNLVVRLDAAATLNLSAMSFITAIGSTGNDKISAFAGTQTLTGGAGTDTLTGYTGGHDTFADTAAGLGGDTIVNWTTADTIDITNIAAANTHALKFNNNTLTVTDGTNSAAIKFAAGQAVGNFTVLGSDGAGGVLIGYHG